jgi:threo-3-hydroxy-D-aspartate ammonia-lyase
MSSANQEHGIVSRVGTIDRTIDGAIEGDIATRFPVGTLLRVMPNHACATGAQFPHYSAVAADGEVHTWSRFYGW